MKFLVVFTAFVLAVSAVTDKEQWQLFKQKHGKEYRNLREEQRRFSIFQDNLRTIESHNELYDQGEETYYMGINKFTDMTPQEFTSMLNYSANARPVSEKPKVWHKKSGIEEPESINWVTKGVVTPVKDQGSCGSCWAFSTTGALEGAYALKYGDLVSFSEQNLLDCCGYGNCQGGIVQFAYQYIIEYGLESESDYPYEENQLECQFVSSKSVTKISSYVDVSQEEYSLLYAVATVGPISVAVNANGFQHYAGGVFSDPRCDGINLNHGVLVVGYGVLDDLDYWLVKNSWGEDWGEDGYLKMTRNDYNQCGIANHATYPVI